MNKELEVTLDNGKTCLGSFNIDGDDACLTFDGLDETGNRLSKDDCLEAESRLWEALWSEIEPTSHNNCDIF